MKNIVNLLFQARILKSLPRSGYAFLGVGKESVSEHSFLTAFVGYVLSELEPDADTGRLVAMCLVHDLPEALIGDMNYVQKQYVATDEQKAVRDTVRNLPFGDSLAELLREFEEGETVEARLAKDADQLALVLELKALKDTGYEAPQKWLPHVLKRLKTETGKKIAESIMETGVDDWWLDHYSDPSNDLLKR